MIRSYDTEYLVDGVPLLIPDGDVEISMSDLDSEDSGRDESGFMYRFVAREKVRTWSFSYFALDTEDFRYLQNLFAGKPSFTFQYRGEDGHAASCTAYCSKSSIVLHNRKTGLYKNMKFNIIEC